MPLETLVATAAGAAVKAAAGAAVSGLAGGAKKKLRGLLSEGPLEAPLRKAFSEAFTGFYKSLDASLAFTYSNEQGLEQLPTTEAFREVVGQLPYVPFRKIEPEPLRKAFLKIGIAGAGEDEFDDAWKALGKRFEKAVAVDDQLKNLLEIRHLDRQEERQEKLLALVTELVEAQKSAAKPPDHGPALQEYCAALYRQYRFADTRGLFMREKETVGEGIELRDVFVETPLAPVREERKPEQAKQLENAKKDSLWREGISRELDLGGGPSRLGELLARERLLVVLGPPGCGKSTLLRCLALTLCHPEGVKPIIEHSLEPGTVPVLLPLKEFASELRDDPNMELERFLLDRFAGRIPGLEQLLANGRTIVLFDGLDEVFEENHRRWVSDQVWQLTSRFARTRFVLTSRPRGYEAAPLPGPVPRWRLLPFDDKQIGSFFRGWFEALAREGAEAGADEPPERRAAELTQEVLARDRLKEMAQNPLLCTLIVLVHRSRSGRLPERRFVFYQAAVETLTEAWERMKRSPHQEEKLEFPEPDVVRRALAEVAWRALHQLASREIPGSELRAWLREYLDREPEWRGEKGDRAVRDFLKLVGERTGLLVDLGGDRYQFVHLSLHEWLVAYFLLDRLNEPQRLEVFRHYLHTPEWEEVLRLMVGGAPQALSDLLVSSLLSRPTGDWEKRLRRDLRFICRCLGDQAPIGPEIRKVIILKVLESLSAGNARPKGVLLRDLAGLGPVPEIRKAAGRMLKHRYTAEAAVDYLAKVAPNDAALRTLFLKMLKRNSTDRHLAVEFLTRAAFSDKGLQQMLAEYLDNSDSLTFEAVAMLFASIAPDDEVVRRRVLLQLHAVDKHVQYCALHFFIRTGADSREQKEISRLLGSESRFVREAAAAFFAEACCDDEEAWRMMLDLLHSNSKARQDSAVSYFFQVHTRDIGVCQSVAKLVSDLDAELAASAIELLAQARWRDDSVKEAALQSIGTGQQRLSSAVGKYLAQIADAGDEGTSQFLLSQVRQKDLSRASIIFFTLTGLRRDDIRSAIQKLLIPSRKDSGDVAFDYFLRIGFDSELAFSLFDASLYYGGYPFQSPLYKEIGRLAASHQELREHVLQQQDKLELAGGLDDFLAGLALEQDHLRRSANPLQLPIPGCSRPAEAPITAAARTSRSGRARRGGGRRPRPPAA